MEPIGSNSSVRTNQSQINELSQQESQKNQLAQPQARADSVSVSNPVADVQLQRSQVVEDIGRVQQSRADLAGQEQQLQTANELAQRASQEETTQQQRDELQSRFQFLQNQQQTNSSSIPGNISNLENARETQSNLTQQLSAVRDQQQFQSDIQINIEQTFPNTSASNEADAALDQQQAQELSTQLKQQFQQAPEKSLDAQTGGVREQTALTLFS